ncbi:MAG TPA: hypothetical protein VF572_03240 [Candidatus Saccharimonadales bacterium]|jgi:hypothetical protein
MKGTTMESKAPKLFGMALTSGVGVGLYAANSHNPALQLLIAFTALAAAAVMTSFTITRIVVRAKR